MAYIKYADVSNSVAQVIAAIEDEDDLGKRADLINNLIKSVQDQLAEPIARLCFELKTAGEPSDTIAVRLGISQRAVLRAIRKRARALGIMAPTDRIQVNGYVDIRDHVRL